MGEGQSAYTYLSTTGTAIAIGTGIQFIGACRAADAAGTLTVKDGATTVFTMSADRSITFAGPVAMRGAVTMTSSGVAFVVYYR